MNIILDIKKINELKFNDKIFIKNSWFFVNKITDYIVGKPNSCKVELVRIGDAISINPQVPLTPQAMCYQQAAEVICDVFCCFENGGANVNYFIDGIFLWIDINGTIAAPDGYYSFGLQNTFRVENGIIVEYFNVDSCVCTPPEPFHFDVCLGSIPYFTVGDCCENPAQTFYGLDPVMYQNLEAWSDLAMTIHVVDGWYYNVGEAYIAQYINGIRTQLTTVTICIP